jgi:hypothetical protein
VASIETVLVILNVNAQRAAVRSSVWLDLSNNDDIVTPLYVVNDAGQPRLG